MKKIIKIVKNNIFGFILGILLVSSVYAATIYYQGSNVGYDNTTTGFKDSNGNNVEDVQTALDELYKNSINSINPNNVKFGMKSGKYVTGNCTTPTLNLGDYVRITPTLTSLKIPTSLTGYTRIQTINPSELTLWRVIKKNDCNVEVVSEYVSSTSLYFKGTIGYRNFVGTLNIIASAYENPTYTVGSRMMGYDGQTEFISDTSGFDGTSNTLPGTTLTSSPTSGTGEEYGGGVLGDTLYLSDYTLVGNVYKSDMTTYGSTGLKAYKVRSTSSATVYWLASRRFSYSGSYFYFIGRGVSASGGLSNYSNVRSYNGSSWYDDSIGYAVRPILTLKSGLTISSGSGTKNDPYILK